MTTYRERHLAGHTSSDPSVRAKAAGKDAKAQAPEAKPVAKAEDSKSK